VLAELVPYRSQGGCVSCRGLFVSGEAACVGGASPV
jgi:hypothetical protein